MNKLCSTSTESMKVFEWGIMIGCYTGQTMYLRVRI